MIDIYKLKKDSQVTSNIRLAPLRVTTMTISNFLIRLLIAYIVIKLSWTCHAKLVSEVLLVEVSFNTTLVHRSATACLIRCRFNRRHSINAEKLLGSLTVRLPRHWSRVWRGGGVVVVSFNMSQFKGSLMFTEISERIKPK